MNWSDERYVRVYTRNTPEWMCLSFPAQGLFCLLLRVVDRAGVLQLGKLGRRAVAVAIGFPGDWPRLEPALDELLADGCLEIVDDHLIVRNFIEAQESESSNAERCRKSRERRRDIKRRVSLVTPPASQVTQDESTRHREHVARVGSDAESVKNDTPCCAVPSRAVPPVPREEATAAPALPSRDRLLAQTHPATAALIEASGGQFAFPAKLDTRQQVEKAVQAAGQERALAAARRSYERTPKPHLGWHLDELRLAAAPPPEPSCPVLDLAWLDQLPEPKRSEAKAAWATRSAEVEQFAAASAVPRILASLCEVVRDEFTRQASGSIQ